MRTKMSSSIMVVEVWFDKTDVAFLRGQVRRTVEDATLVCDGADEADEGEDSALGLGQRGESAGTGGGCRAEVKRKGGGEVQWFGRVLYSVWRQGRRRTRGPMEKRVALSGTCSVWRRGRKWW